MDGKLIYRPRQTDKNIFAKMLYENGKSISSLEYKIYNRWFNFMSKSYKYDIKNIIYLRVDPVISFERIKNRNRVEEKDIKLDYIKSVHNYHEKWLIKNKNENKDEKKNICVIDVTKDFRQNKKVKEEILLKITNFIKTIR